MSHTRLIPFPSDDDLALDAARQWTEHLESAAKGPYRVAFSGGRIARKFFQAVAQEAAQKPALLKNVHFFWADERCVPPEHPESNFLLARQGLFDPAEIRLEKVHRIHGEKRPEEAARLAIDELMAFTEQQRGIPILDMVFLGMGEDGHIASLFPGTERTNLEEELFYHPVVASKPPPNRITMGYRLLENAKNVWVLASGQGKQNALKGALDSAVKNPLGRLLKLRQQTLVFSDIAEHEGNSPI